MLTAIAQSVEISTLKTSASLPIQIRIRRSTSGQAVRLRKAMASPSQTSAVDRRCWRALAKYVTARRWSYVITSISIERSFLLFHACDSAIVGRGSSFYGPGRREIAGVEEWWSYRLTTKWIAPRYHRFPCANQREVRDKRPAIHSIAHGHFTGGPSRHLIGTREAASSLA